MNDLNEELRQLAYKLMGLTNKIYSKYESDDFIMENIWRALSFYSRDLLNKVEILKTQEKTQEENHG